MSAEGGRQPVWRSDGRELYYLGRDGTLFAVQISGARLVASKPVPLFRAPVDTMIWDSEQYTTLDGNRFLMLTPVSRPPRPINVIVNWPALLDDRTRQ